MRRDAAWAAVGVTLALAGCGWVPGATSADRPLPQTTSAPIRPVTVGLGDTGKSLLVHIGQQLVVRLGPTFSVPPSTTPSVHYPADLLSLKSELTTAGTYIFQGRRVGIGRIWIVQPGCDPGPALGALGPPADCPVVGPASSDGARRASWLFTATVRVVPLGL